MIIIFKEEAPSVYNLEGFWPSKFSADAFDDQIGREISFTMGDVPGHAVLLKANVAADGTHVVLTVDIDDPQRCLIELVKSGLKYKAE